jgi:hypothetical protein
MGRQSGSRIAVFTSSRVCLQDGGCTWSSHSRAFSCAAIPIIATEVTQTPGRIGS